jgi:SAM-dependent methyltransferase
VAISKAKLSFLRRVLWSILAGQPRACPYCGESSGLKLIGRKKLIVEVLRCSSCALIFRYPAESPNGNFNYYQKEYKAAAVTNLPSEHDLERLIRTDFAGSPLDYTSKIQALKTLKPSGRVLDFGCSWGYVVYQLSRHGYQSAGFEISKERAAFGRERLGLQIFDSVRDLNRLGEPAFDIIFTNHVLEHLPAPKETLGLFSRLLADDGLLFLIGPNFTGANARSGLFWRWIGTDHPLAPTDEFLKTVLPRNGFQEVVCGSGPFGERLVQLLWRREFDALDVEGDELLVMAWKMASQADLAKSYLE